MKRWFSNRNVRTKLMLAYLLFALAPTLVIVFYTYNNTKKILMESLYEQLQAQAEFTGKNLDEKTNGYYAISNMLYMDSTLHNYLTMNYSERGYEDLYLYVSDLFASVQTVYPDISRISVHTSNATLPRDGFYFFYLEDKKRPDWYAHTARNGGILHMQNGKEDTVSFTRLMNMYESGKYEIFVELEFMQEYMNEMLGGGNEDITHALTDEEGRITASDHPELVGKRLAAEELEGKIVVQIPTLYCGTLIMYTESGRFNAQAERAASRIFLIFFISSGAAFFFGLFYSRSFAGNVEKVLHGAQAIGEGRLEYRIPDPGEDEIGQIARSVNRMGERLESLIEESWKKELAKKSSELNLLQEQINPHFLYNALSSLSSLAMKNRDRDTCKAILCLSEFYRISLSKGRQEVSVEEEIKLLESYLKIQKMRFGDIIKVEYELDPRLLGRSVVKLTLQPLVENAIHHGRRDDSGDFHILIRLFEEAGRTVLEVIDDGCGMAAEKLMELQHSMNKSESGYGLKNVNIRIRLRYGEEYGVYIESEPGFGTNVRVELPGGGRSE